MRLTNPDLDIAGYDKNNQLVLIVEVKQKLRASSEWVTKLRRNMLAHGYFPQTSFFLLVTPDRFYLWKNAGVLPEIIQPDYEIDATPILQPYADRTGVPIEHMSGRSLELIVEAWLDEIMRSDIPPAKLGSTQNWLFESGLYDAIKGGHAVLELAA
ncbi:hypothetical protein [Pseudanabaena sp. PCC 6802]|uniref:hypothetical protein n=1 Tax=Pseudanabaena sp. PCC 6802 TaxID=118173 RepID=UPI0003452C25|nr:hypothetical protein [Pseudanabaena sp. PCC 6802]